MNLLVAITIMIAWRLFLNNLLQDPSVLEKRLLLEKRAVVDTQRLLASELDAELPRLPFADWFGKVVGPRTGVIWQLSECGEQRASPSDPAGDLRACVEVNTILPDGRKVIVMITVGTFKKGMIGAPAFYYAVIEQQDELYDVRQLHDLPKLLWAPGSLVKRPAVKLPAVNIPKVGLVANDAYVAKLPEWSDRRPGQPATIEAPPPQVESQPSTATSRAGNQEISEEPGLTASSGAPKLSGSVSWGDAITKVQPKYPASAKRANASGSVDVLITISNAGRVIEAKAISGHPLLRDTAVEAARQWVFKPATLNGAPVETQIVLTFVFKVPQ